MMKLLMVLFLMAQLIAPGVNGQERDGTKGKGEPVPVQVVMEEARPVEQREDEGESNGLWFVCPELIDGAVLSCMHGQP